MKSNLAKINIIKENRKLNYYETLKYILDAYECIYCSDLKRYLENRIPAKCPACKGIGTTFDIHILISSLMNII